MNAELCRQWLQRAKSNLARAEFGRATPDILYEDLCFDAQQACEKSLKALMIYLGMDVHKTHSIGYILMLIEASGKVKVPENLREAAILTDYAVTTRYPGDWDPIDEAEYKQAVFLAKAVYQWVLSIIK